MGDGVELRQAESVSAAVGHLESGSFDMILLEREFSGGLAVETLSTMGPVCGEVPVVIVSEKADESLASEAIARGACDFLCHHELTPGTMQRLVRYAVRWRRMSERLEQAERRLELDGKRAAESQRSAHELIGRVSHDFRTPLTVIKEYAGILRDGLIGKVSEKQREILAVVDDRADDLAILVDNMLDAAERNAGLLRIGQEITAASLLIAPRSKRKFAERTTTIIDCPSLSAWRRRANVGDILGQVVPALSARAAIKKVGFDVALDDDLPEVYCDPDQIGRVIVNLANSALKSSLGQGSVKVWARSGYDTSEVTIGVTGNGWGVPEDDVEVIGEQLHRADAGALNDRREVELGLSVAAELVRLNLGRMDVAHEAGQGTTISFGVPVWNAPALADRCLDRFERAQPPIREAALIVASVDLAHRESFAAVIDEFLQRFFRGDEVAVQVEPCKWLIIAGTGPSEVGPLLDEARAAWAGSARTRSPAEWPTIELKTLGVWPLDTERWRLLETYGQELALGSDKTIDWLTYAR